MYAPQQVTMETENKRINEITAATSFYQNINSLKFALTSVLGTERDEIRLAKSRKLLYTYEVSTQWNVHTIYTHVLTSFKPVSLISNSVTLQSISASKYATKYTYLPTRNRFFLALCMRFGLFYIYIAIYNYVTSFRYPVLRAVLNQRFSTFLL